ncbi:CsbD family protein [Nocardia thailandica]
MSLNDKIGNKFEEFAGKAKEVAGSVTGNDDLRDEGRAQQAGAAAKEAVTELKDAARKIKKILDR